MKVQANATQPIGIFDSGVGGFTLAQELIKQLPQEDFIYFGDLARNPYGLKSIDEVAKFSLEIGNFFIQQGVKAILIACNTASIAALKPMQQHFNIPVLGVVNAGVSEALRLTKNKKIAYIATSASVNSQVFDHLLNPKHANMKVTALTGDKLVPLAEAGVFNGKEVEGLINNYIDALNDSSALLLACTHFPLFIETFNKYLPSSVCLINPAAKAIDELKETLKEAKLLNCAHKAHKFYVNSPNHQEFGRLCRHLFHQQITYINIGNEHAQHS